MAGMLFSVPNDASKLCLKTSLLRKLMDLLRGIGCLMWCLK